MCDQTSVEAEVCEATGTVARRSWGLRFSMLDACALAALGTVAAVLYSLDNSLWWVVVMVGVHFFLFCNVFRVLRRRELIWAAIFISNVGMWLLLGRLAWFNVLILQWPVSTGILAWELSTSRY